MFNFVSGPPTLPQLLRLKIPQRVGANYSTFGILLLNDAIGSRVQALTMASQGNIYHTILRILQEWLEGRGLEPVTWETLIKTLKDSDLSALADEVQQNLLISPHLYQNQPPLPASPLQPSGSCTELVNCGSRLPNTAKSPTASMQV